MLCIKRSASGALNASGEIRFGPGSVAVSETTRGSCLHFDGA